ncbi:MAG: hypothetical protein ACE145_11585 [Terriglobia bacterium]
MVRAACLTMALVVWLGWASTGRAQGDYLDILVVKVDPAKRAALDAAAKKMTEACRRNHGDNWIAMETVYGEQNTITLVSTRRTFADIDKGYELFYGAMNQAYGPAGTAKILQDFPAATKGSRGEIRRRRWDLSANVPSDPADLNRLVGDSRLVRTTTIRIRPGHVLRFEEQLRIAKQGVERGSDKRPILVSQSVAGDEGTAFYISWLAKTWSDFDSMAAIPQIFGAEGYQKFLAVSAESVEGSQTVINHFVPEISNPPESVVSASPGFWTPKPLAVKIKAAAPSKPEAKEKK